MLPLDEAFDRYWRHARRAVRKPMSLPDISDWYSKEGRAIREEAVWILEQRYKRDAAFVAQRMKTAGLTSVVELGCGSGLFARELRGLLPGALVYLGVDDCQEFVDRAKRRVPALCFARDDLRADHSVAQGWDVVVCLQTLKNFGLHEWDQVARHVLSLGRYAALSVQTIPRVDLDDGAEFHHVYVTQARLERVLGEAGHEVLDRQRANAWDLSGYGEAEDWMLWTKNTSVP